MAIKDWRKGKVSNTWFKHTGKDKLMLSFRKSRVRGIKYIVVLHTYTEKLVLNVGLTKTEANRYAKAYMRKH